MCKYENASAGNHAAHFLSSKLYTKITLIKIISQSRYFFKFFYLLVNILFCFQALDFGMQKVQPFLAAENRTCDENILIAAAAHVHNDYIIFA